MLDPNNAKPQSGCGFLLAAISIVVVIIFVMGGPQGPKQGDVGAGGTSDYPASPITSAYATPETSGIKASTVRTRSASTDSIAQSADSQSIEYQLATIYEGDPPTDIVVREFATVLDSLEAKCKPTAESITTRHGISNVILKTQEIMDSRSVHENVLELAHHLNESIPDDFHHQVAFQEVGAAYIVLRAPRR